MTKEQWNEWYLRLYDGLPQVGRILLDQSVELQAAIGSENYALAERIIMEMFPDSIWQ